MKKGINGDHPICRAKAVWDMQNLTGSWQFPFDLEPIGNVKMETLDKEEAAEAAKRGLTGDVCRLDNGCLALNTYRAAALRPKQNSYSIYMRVYLENTFDVCLFSSDFLGLVLHPSGYLCAFAAQKISQGHTYREIPLAKVSLQGWCDCILIIDENNICFYLNGEKKCKIPMLWQIEHGFTDDLVIGGRRCCKPDTYDTTVPHSRMKGLINTFAIWQYCLQAQEIALLSGCRTVVSADREEDAAAICRAYNAFFDASVQADVERCREIYAVLRNYAVQDPSRPLYHLTQPFGAIYYPCGAFWYDNRYHVFSYRNINYLLEYSSLDHYVSRDLIHWTEYPIGPFTDSEEDIFCIYLMNHFIDEAGKLRILYTGQGIRGKCGVLAESNDNAVTYTNKKAVLTEYHHDGHVFRHDGKWYTITSRMMKGKRPDGKGDAVMLFSSDDLEHWTEEGEIFSQPRPAWNAGGFLEFPYLLFYGEKAVLMVGGDIRYFIGTFDWETKKFIPDQPEGIRLDPVNPFYCLNPMCVDNKGEGGTERRIIMGLYSQIGSTGHGILPWSCVHTMPRVLTFMGDHLRQDPVPEAEELRGRCIAEKDIVLHAGESFMLAEKMPPYTEISAVFSPDSTGDCGVILIYDAQEIRVVYHAEENGYEICGDAVNLGRSPAYRKAGEALEIRLFTDSRLIKVYINGQVCTTASANPVPTEIGIGILAEKGNIHCRSLQVWELERNV